MFKVVSNIVDYFNKGDIRTINAKKNVLALIFLKGINILTGFLIVPITINYVSAETYGIWLTLSAVIIWISYFDLGLPNGFRNRFAEAKALGKHRLAKIYVSTTYAIISLLFGFIFILLILLNHFVDWSSVFNVSIYLRQELHDVFFILSIFICIRIIASVFTFMLLADQKPAFSSAVLTLGQIAALFTIFIFTKTISGSLYYLALAISGIPCLILVIMTIGTFCTKHYKRYAPSYKYVRLSMTPQLLGLGIQFSIITISGLVILQLINIVISKELGSICVTQYNISYKYFSVAYMLAELIVSPFWSGFTEAYVQNDYKWMYRCFRKLEIVVLLCIPTIFVMFLLSHVIIRIWVGDSVTIPTSLSAAMSFFVLFQSAYCIYSNMIYGIGRTRLQLIFFIILSISSFLFIKIGINYFGFWGCMVYPSITYLLIALICRIQIKKVLLKKDKGIWSK